MAEPKYVTPEDEMHEEAFAENGEAHSSDEGALEEINQKLDAILLALNIGEEQ